MLTAVAGARERFTAAAHRAAEVQQWQRLRIHATTESPIAFERTSGTTGEPRLVPITRSSLAAIQRAAHAWLDDLLTARPAIAGGRMYWAISPAGRGPETTADGIPIGLNDAAYFGPGLEAAISSLLVAPEAGSIGDVDNWRACTLDALRRAHDLTLISVWSPTFLCELLRHIDEPIDRLWPRLDTVSCWTGAASGLFAEQLRERLPRHVHLQGKGLLATEGVVTIPLDGCAFPVLAVESGFFEFADDAGAVRLGHELEMGAEYEVWLTTYGGLRSHSLGDRVRVQGWLGQAPQLEFLGRSGCVSDLTGEKLTEPFVLEALRSSAGLRGFAMLAPARIPRPHYILFSEQDCDVNRIDQWLCRNPHYAYARRLGQLGPLQLVRTTNALDRYTAYMLGRGMRLGDIKAPVLRAEHTWHEILSP